MSTPKTCLPFNAKPNNAIPTSVVNKGATEFNIEVIPLLISVCANVKKKGGKKELQSPAIATHFQSLLDKVLKDL